MNPLQKTRDGATKARTAVAGRARALGSGTTRTADWIKGSVTGGVGKARDGVAGAFGTAKDGAGNLSDNTRDGVANIWESSGGARLVHNARSNPRIAIAWATLALVVVAWIAWAIYVTAEHGANAGLGVVISWPALFAALALIATPFAGGWLLYKRLSDDDAGPPIAGGSNGDSGEDELITGGTYPG